MIKNEKEIYTLNLFIWGPVGAESAGVNRRILVRYPRVIVDLL